MTPTTRAQRVLEKLKSELAAGSLTDSTMETTITHAIYGAHDHGFQAGMREVVYINSERIRNDALEAAATSCKCAEDAEKIRSLKYRG